MNGWGAVLLLGVAQAQPAQPAQSAQPAKPPAEARTGWFGAPILAYTPETGLAYGAAGLRYFVLSGGRNSIARLDARYTTRNQLIVRARSRIYWGDNFLRLWGSYEHFPDFYYGIGPETVNAPEAYTPIEWRGAVTYERRIWRRLFVGGAYELTQVTVQDRVPGGLLERSRDLVGRDGGWQSGVGAQITWDARDNVNATRTGTFARASWMGFHPALGSTYSYRRLALDARHFMPVWREHVLALRGLMRHNGGGAPFYDLALLGGRTLMRGLYEGRFRDVDLLAFQAEYRLPLWWRFGLAGFVSTGQVGRSISALDFSNSQFAGGGGLRFAVSEPSRLNARIDVGASADGAKFYFTFNEAF